MVYGRDLAEKKMARPNTATRKRQEQVQDDQDLARIYALEEDEKIAQKIQRDFENGIENNDYHRINSRGQVVYMTRDEWERGEFDQDFNQSPAQSPTQGQSHSSPTNRPTGPGANSQGLQRNSLKNRDTPSSSNISVQRPVSRPASKEPRNFKTMKESSTVESLSSEPSAARKYPYNDQRVNSPSKTETDDDYEAADSDYNDSASLSNPLTGGNKYQAQEQIQNQRPGQAPPGQQSLDPKSMEKDIQQLLQMIKVYQPENIEPEQRLVIFVPDYIPAVGDIDPILKVQMPLSMNGKELPQNVLHHEKIGITHLDEPHLIQSDPALVDLALRAMSLREPHESKISVRSIQLSGTDSKNSSQKTLQTWIDTVADLQQKKNRPAQNIKGLQASDLEKLMAEWPAEIDGAISRHEIGLPTAEMDLTLKEFSHLCCNILDIPVRIVMNNKKGDPSKRYIESLSCLMSLYLLFKNNQHFGLHS